MPFKIFIVFPLQRILSLAVFSHLMVQFIVLLLTHCQSNLPQKGSHWESWWQDRHGWNVAATVGKVASDGGAG